MSTFAPAWYSSAAELNTDYALQQRERPVSESATTSLTFCADAAVCVHPPHDEKRKSVGDEKGCEGGGEKKIGNGMGIGGILQGQMLIEDTIFRPPVHARAEEHLLQLRIPQREHQKVYVIPTCFDDRLHRLSSKAHSNRNIEHPPRHDRILTHPQQTTGARRLSEERPPVPAACAPSSSSPASSATASSRAHPRVLVVPRPPPHK